jgi:hypothetical protein
VGWLSLDLVVGARAARFVVREPSSGTRAGALSRMVQLATPGAESRRSCGVQRSPSIAKSMPAGGAVAPIDPMH